MQFQQRIRQMQLGVVILFLEGGLLDFWFWGHGFDLIWTKVLRQCSRHGRPQTVIRKSQPDLTPTEIEPFIVK
jgi:hypothetical protein